MSKKIKLRDKTVLSIVDLYVADEFDWRFYWKEMGEVLQALRGASRG